MADATIRVVLTAATLLTGRAVAQDSLACTFFTKPNLIMVGGHEDNTRVIPVVLDYITLDLTLDRSCHALTWGRDTVEGAGERSLQDLICFNINFQASDDSRDIAATFVNKPDSGKLAGVTKTVATISSAEDRATAIKLAERCHMQSQTARNGADGLDIEYSRRLPLRVVIPPVVPLPV